jgi:hypothetical protein
LLGEDEESLGRCGSTEIDTPKTGTVASETGLSSWAEVESEEKSSAICSLGAQINLGFALVRHHQALWPYLK